MLYFDHFPILLCFSSLRLIETFYYIYKDSENLEKQINHIGLSEKITHKYWSYWVVVFLLLAQ